MDIYIWKKIKTIFFSGGSREEDVDIGAEGGFGGGGGGYSGSYNNGSNPTNSFIDSTGNGKVIITFI